MPIEEFFEEWDVESLKHGDIIRARGFESREKDSRPTIVKNMRVMISHLNDLYSKGKIPSKKEFNEIFEKHQKNMSDEVDNVLDDLENSEEFFKVEKKEESDSGDITIKLKKLDKTERIKIIKSIAKKLAEKMTKEQLQTMLEEGIKKLNDTKTLKEIDEELNKESPKIKGNKGCYKLQVNGKDIILLH